METILDVLVINGPVQTYPSPERLKNKIRQLKRKEEISTKEIERQREMGWYSLISEEEQFFVVFFFRRNLIFGVEGKGDLEGLCHHNFVEP